MFDLPFRITHTHTQVFPDLDELEQAEDLRVEQVTRDVFRRNTHKKIVDDGLKRQAMSKKSVCTTF
jgi:hypothetical protein